MYYRQAKKRRFMNGVEDRLTIYVSNFVLLSTSHGLLLASLCNHTINCWVPKGEPIYVLQTGQEKKIHEWCGRQTNHLCV